MNLSPVARHRVVAALLVWLGMSFCNAPDVQAADFHTLVPCRVFDSRIDDGVPPPGPGTLAPGTYTVQIEGPCGIPAEATQVWMNVTAVLATAPGHLTVYKSGAMLPGTSNLNFKAGENRANNMIVALSTGGAVDVNAVMAGGSVHVLIDTVGYFVDKPTVLTAGATLSYTENDPPTVIDNTITVSDGDSTDLQWATVQITGNYQNGQDVLSFADTADITGTFNAGSGTLTLTPVVGGTRTLADWQAALRSVLYANTSEDPVTSSRTVTWIANDGSTSSAPVTSTIDVTTVPDAPVLTAGAVLSYTEGDPATVIDATITVADADDVNLESATVQITSGYQNGADVLSFVDTATITGAWNAAAGTLTLTGSDTKANWQAALRSVRYENTSASPTTATRTVTWIASDGGLTSAPVTSTINFTDNNTAPVLTAGATLSYTENDPPTAIDTTITVTDADDTDLESATVQITGNYQNGEDVLSFANTATITGVFSAATGTLTLTGTDTKANWQTALRSVLYNNTSEDPSTLARTVTWIANDGSASSAPVTSTINVTNVPDAPVLTAGGVLNYTENDPPTAIDTTITVTDLDDVNLESATVQITGNYQNGQDVLSFVNTATITGAFNAATGTLTLTGTDTKANWQTALRNVLYNNTSEDPSTLARTVTWIASDGGLSSAPVTSTINVAAEADAPVVTAGGTLSYTENDPPTAIDTTITVTDNDSANLQSATVQITGNYQNGQDVLSFVNTATITGVFTAATGTLTLTGTDTVANWQTALRSVRYNNTSENPSTLPRTVTWIASDGGASSTPVTSTVNVTAVPDAPVVTAGGVLNYTENDPPTAIDTTITVTDADSANLQSATVQITGNYQNGEDILSFTNTATITGVFNAATGMLTLTGADTQANWQTALRNVRYNNTSNSPSTSARTVTWIVSDGGLTSTPVTSTINVADAPDAPVVTAGGTLNYTENDPATAIDTTITVTDEDSTNLQSATVQITGNYQNGQDVLSFVNTATITGVFSAATGTLTLTGTDSVANWQTALRSVRYNNTSENPSTLARTVTWIASDGGASSAPVTSTVNVTAVPDAPVVVAGGTLSYTENDPATAIDGALTVTDADSANLQSATVQITGNYQNGQDILSFSNTATITGVFNAATGTLTLTGTDTVANWQTALRNVRYSNPSDNPSALTRTVTWIVSDGGLSSTPVTSSINVIPVNDPPRVNNALLKETFHTIGNTAFEFKAAQSLTPGVWVAGKLLDHFFPDPDGPAASLTVTLGTATAGAEVVIAADGSFSYIPPPGATGTDTFTYVVSDGLDSVTRTVTINLVERVWYVRNNAPAGGDGQSDEPFDTLAEAQTASGPNDFIFVYRGDGTNLGHIAGIVLKNGQRLIGEHIGLSVPTPVGFNGAVAAGNLNLVTGVGGNHPLIGDAAGNGISATDAVPVDIAGVNVASSGNAIHWTTAAGFAGTNTGLTIRDVIVRGAGGKGVNILLQGTGALRLAFRNNELTSTGIGLDVQETGTGSLTITDFLDNEVFGNTGGTGINIANAIFDAVPGGGVNNVNGNTLQIGTLGNGVGGSGLVMTGVQGSLSFGAPTIYADNGAGLRIAGTAPGAMTFGLTVSGMSVIEATGGPAVDVSNTALTLPLASLKSTNSPTTGVALNSITGSFSAGSGSSISGITAAATAFQVGSSNATIDYAGTITTTQGTGVNLTTNTGSTISFTGTLTLSSGTNTAFNATGGGTVTTTDTASTLTSTTGTALNVANTTIGAGGLKFRSISAGTGSGSAGIGIVLDTTGTGASNGGLTVTGSGSAGSGGTIQHKTGGNGSTTSGIGIYLNRTKAASFSRMQLNDFDNFAIRANEIDGLTLNDLVVSGVNGNSTADDEGSLFLEDAGGAINVSNTVVSGGLEDNFRVHYDNAAAGPAAVYNVTGTTFRDLQTAGNNSLVNLRSTTAASSSWSVAFNFTGSCVFENDASTLPPGGTENFADGILATFEGPFQHSLNVQNATFHHLFQGMDIASNFSADVNYTFKGNTITFTEGVAAIALGSGSSSTNQSLITGLIQGNTIGTSGVAQSGNRLGLGIVLDMRGEEIAQFTLHGNNIRRTEVNGIQVIGQTAADGNLDIQITNNTIAEIEDNGGGGAGVIYGIEVTTNNATSHDICLDARNNDSFNINAQDIRVRQSNAAVTFAIEGLTGSGTSDVNVENYLVSVNPGNTADVRTGGSIVSYTSVANCTTPATLP